MNAQAASETTSDASLRALWDAFCDARNERAREQLIEHYLPLARVAAARLFRFRPDDSVAFDDYLQYARIGLVEAIDGYDPHRQASFETYSSYRIRGAMLNGLGRETEVSAQRNFWRTRTQERVDSLKPGKSSSGEQELAEMAQMAIGLAMGFLLEHELEELPDDSVHANPYAATEVAQLTHVVRAAVEQLPARERQLIRQHYFEQCEFRVIAGEMAVTAGRVSQLHAQALGNIRKLLRAPADLDRKV